MPRFFNRPPRILPELPTGEITIPNPPAANPVGGKLGMLTMALPLVTILGYALIGGRGGSLLFILPMGLAAGVTTFVAFLSWRRNQDLETQKQKNYETLLDDVEQRILTAHEKQLEFLDYTLPSPEKILGMANETSLRLWERRPTDHDFGLARLGTGIVPATVMLKPPSNEDINAPLLLKARKLAEDHQNVLNAPIALSLRQVSGVGLYGDNRDQIRDSARSAVVHLAGTHSPNELRLYIIGDAGSKAAWDWMAWLPHCSSSQGDQFESTQLCFEQDQATGFWSNLQVELERRRAHGQAQENNPQTFPLIVVLIDMLSSRAEDSPLDYVMAEAAVTMLLNSGRELFAAAIFLVPDRAIVPSECQAVVEVRASGGKPQFRYDHVGLNGLRRDGLADLVKIDDASNFARKLAPLAVRTTYGVDLPYALALTDLMGNRIVEEQALLNAWHHSQQPNSEWPRVEIGQMMGNKPRTLVFSASEDGVHGLVAGTTGVGKSELLMTLVVGLAVRYAPSIVNFVLVDYKGGTAFKSFLALPHVVDVITNLQGQAGNRMFSAIRAELNRRAGLLAEVGARDITAYRERGLHANVPLPHLFIIIDEFAEMIKERPEFKVQLDSIARLGRALGVHLILATQRPSGVVSDQIRANMKFRLCLRVESSEDSRELLGRTDAAFLPQNVPGRAYLQVGNDKLDLLQVARVGGSYQGPRIEAQPPIIWVNRQARASAENPDGPDQGAQRLQETLADVIIRHTQLLMKNYPDEFKEPERPWPDPLPELLLMSFDKELNYAFGSWLSEGEGKWHPLDWLDEAMRVPIGLLDDPSRAAQSPLILDFTIGHVVVFGASGWGKTTLLRTLIAGLASTHSPSELNVYLLDFGGRGLDVFSDLPHVGAIIPATEPERVQRLLRKLNSTLEARKNKLSQAQVSSLAEYNHHHQDAPLPAILLVLDNFAEFRESFAEEMDVFTVLARDGRAYGIHVLVTAEQLGTLPSKVYSLFTERLALKLSDSTEYTAIVGRGVPELADLPGRGFVRRDRTPLEFQVALPVWKKADEQGGESIEEIQSLRNLVDNMAAAWSGARPEPIEVLQPIISLRRVLETSPELAVGLLDWDLSPAVLDFKRLGPHFAIVGPPLSGKTTALRTLALGMASQYTPQQLALILVDFQRRFIQYEGVHSLDDLPHVLTTVSEVSELEQVAELLRQEFVLRKEQHREGPRIVVLIDNYDEIASIMTTQRPLCTRLGELARRHGVEGLNFVVASSVNGSRGDDFIRQVLASRYGLGLDASDAPSALGARLRGVPSVEFPPGRGYIVKAGRPTLVQIATPQIENCTLEESLDAWVTEVCSRDLRPAAWQKE